MRAQVRKTRRPKTSPMTEARMPPEGLVRATMCPMRNPATTSEGIRPCTRQEAAWWKSSVLSSSFRKTRRCSAVAPDGPARHRDARHAKLANNLSVLRARGPSSGLKSAPCWQKHQASNVAWLAGASGAACSAGAAAAASASKASHRLATSCSTRRASSAGSTRVWPRLR